MGEKQYKRIYDATKDNQLSVLKSSECLCLFCDSRLSSRDIKDWVDTPEGVSAVCPICQADAILPDPEGSGFTKDEISRAKAQYFNLNYALEHSFAASMYVAKFLTGTLERNPQNEQFFIQIARHMADNGDPFCAFNLAEFYENGSEWTELNLNEAVKYYGLPCLKNDPVALYKLGRIYLYSGPKEPFMLDIAYDYFLKGMALNSVECRLGFAEVILNNRSHHYNPDLGRVILIDIFNKGLSKFIESHGQDNDDIYHTSYLFGKILMDTKIFAFTADAQYDKMVALRPLLLADLAYNYVEKEGDADCIDLDEHKDIKRRIKRLAKKMGLHKEEPSFDNDTFFDSIEFINAFGSLSHGVMKISSLVYDEYSRSLSFNIEYEKSPLIVDSMNLYCDFGPSEIHWSFSDVISYTRGNISEFNSINAFNPLKWILKYRENNETENTMTIVFLPVNEEDGDVVEENIDEEEKA
ncbi:MAG: hypothetical protein K5694_02595 [Bacilli bacterium]|nr:hypothetical protein [Bacilli bacterium]